MQSTTLSFALLLALCGCAHADGPAPVDGLTQVDANVPTAEQLDLTDADIAGLQASMASGKTSSLALTRAYLQRIATLDRAGPKLNSVIELNPQAEADARALDAERRAGRVRGPLHSIPVLLKDNIDAVPMVNSAGSLALADFKPSRDAFLVQRLRAAGAVILGKTNLSEWANFRSTKSSSGWSARGGLTRNPYALDRNPCGSSAGTGAAIAASLATVGIGTETDGSITCPASVNGLVGLKPTVGLISRDGIIPISASQDTAGPMTRSVADAAALLPRCCRRSPHPIRRIRPHATRRLQRRTISRTSNPMACVAHDWACCATRCAKIPPLPQRWIAPCRACVQRGPRSSKPAWPPMASGMPLSRRFCWSNSRPG